MISYDGHLQVLSVNGISEEQLDAELQARIEEADRARYFQEAVHSVLLASAQAEVEHLRQELADSAQQISQLQSRSAWILTMLHCIILLTKGHVRNQSKVSDLVCISPAWASLGHHDDAERLDGSADALQLHF